MTLILNTVGCGGSEEELRQFRQVLEENFPDEEVVKLSESNRLRQLWHRSDFIAANELLSLAYAIENLREIDPKWTSDHVKKILRGDSNEQIGSFFELGAASMLLTGGLEVELGKRNSPGYDLSVSYGDGHKTFISLKNHDVSTPEREFVTRCKEFRDQMVKIFGGRGIHPWILIDAKRLLSNDDWSLLTASLPQVMLTSKIQRIEITKGISMCGLSQMKIEGNKLAKSPTSNQLIVRCCYHPNEQKNFASKLESAALNMRKHIKGQDNFNSIVFMRVHPTASIPFLEQAATKLIESNSGIDGVILYQPSIVRTASEIVISHFQKTVCSDRWDIRNHPLPLRPYAGQWLTNPSIIQFQLNGKTIESKKKGYFYQEADFFPEFELKLGTFHLTNPASGIHINPVIGGVLISALSFPEEDNLLLM